MSAAKKRSRPETDPDEMFEDEEDTVEVALSAPFDPEPPAPQPTWPVLTPAVDTSLEVLAQVVQRLRHATPREKQGLRSWAQRTQGGTRGALLDALNVLLGD